MQTEEIVISSAVTADLSWKEVLVMPVGDVQLGAEGCDLDRFKRHVEWGMERGAYFLGMGDYVDVASPSNRVALRTAKLYDSVHNALEESAARALEELLRITRGSKWLGVLQGHHYYEFPDGTTTDTRFAQAHNTAFLGDCALVRLRFTRGNKSLPCIIWCHHGAGSGVGAGAPLTKLQSLIPFFDADIYLMGHMHKIVSAPIDQLYITRSTPPSLRHRTKLVAGTGSFLRGYTQNSTRAGRASGSYVEKAMMPPTSLGGVVIYIAPKHHEDEDRLDLRVSL